MKWPWHRHLDEPRGIKLAVPGRRKRYRLVPVFSHIDDEGIKVWRIVLHRRITEDVFIDRDRPVGVTVRKMPGRCTMAFGFVQDAAGSRVMRYDEVKDVG